MINGRKILLAIWLSVCLLMVENVMAADAKVYRIGLTPVILTNQTSFLEEWEQYLSRQLKTPVKFVQRQTYKEVTDLLLNGNLDAAWLCGYPFVRNREKLKLLAVPIFAGKPLYRAYLIVPTSDTQTKDLDDLKHKVFAFSDPNSNSGFLYPQVRLLKMGIEPRHFFAKSFFAWSHRDVVKAVADGVAQGGSVDGYVWETLAKYEPALTAGTRPVIKSEEFGFPPLVTRKDISQQDFLILQQALLDMSSVTEGRGLLRRMNLDGFVEGSESLYDGIAESVSILDGPQ
jgi:phosphate/phosphite/phosphonate ABC transporter binding protein